MAHRHKHNNHHKHHGHTEESEAANANEEFKLIQYDDLWVGPPKDGTEFGVPGIVRAPQGGVKFTDDEEVQRQKGVIMHLIKSLGSNLLEGKSMINISLPVRIFEPRSFLQRMTDIWCYAPLFITRAAIQEDPVERLKWVVVWFIAGLHRGTTNKKPFNPILGETFQGRYEDGTTLYLEQVSHHPPISAFQVMGPEGKWHYHGHHECTASFRPNGIVAGQKGPNSITFQNGDTITFQMPRVRLTGIVLGDRFYTYMDTVTFVDVNNNLQCELTLDPDALSGVRAWIQSAASPSDTVRGKITQNDQLVCEMEGSWLGQIKFGGLVYWTQGQYRPYQVFPLPDQEALPSDSRFRSDLIALKNDDYVLAQSEKERLEEVQRQERRLRKSNSLQIQGEPRRSPQSTQCGSSPNSTNSNAEAKLIRSSSWNPFNRKPSPSPQSTNNNQ